MNVKTFLIHCTALCLLASCKKNSDSTAGAIGNNGNVVNKLKYYVEEDHLSGNNQTDSFSFVYNGNALMNMTGTNLKFVYGYPAPNVVTFDLYEHGAFSIHEIAYLKGAYVDSAFQYNSSLDSTTQKYVYNGNLLISETDYDYSAAGGAVPFRRDTYTYDSKGNMIKDVEDNGVGGINTIKTYTYTDKLLQVSTSPVYVPLFSKNLPATLTVTDGAGNVYGTVTYSYVFDSSGRLTKETDMEDNGGYVIKTYGY
jgi:hypothetical protein